MDIDAVQDQPKVMSDEVFEQGAFKKYASDVEATYHLLLLAAEAVTPQMVHDWSPEQRMLAARWAATVYLIASDNDDIQEPPKPSFLPGPAPIDLIPGTIMPVPAMPYVVNSDPSTGRAVYTLSLAERAFIDRESAASNMMDEGDQAPVLPEVADPAPAPDPVTAQGLEYDQPDQNGYAPDITKLGTRWTHFKTGRVYVITGFKMNCMTELWAYEYVEWARWGAIVPPYVRDVVDFHAYVSDVRDDQVARFAPA